MKQLLAVLIVVVLVLCPLGTTSAQSVSSDELRAYLYATAPYPEWQDATIWCESRWLPWVTNESSGAAGLAQFMPATWEWASDYYGVYGDPYNPYDAIRLMNLLWADGYMYWWECA